MGAPPALPHTRKRGIAMKRVSYATIMRWIAGAVYLLLAGYQMLALRHVLNNANAVLATVPVAWGIEVLLMLLAGGLAAWLYAKNGRPSPSMRHSIVVITIMVVLFELTTYAMQAELIGYSVTMLFPSLAGSDIWNYIFIILRLMLWILGAFFVLSTKDDPAAVRSAAAGPMTSSEAKKHRKQKARAQKERALAVQQAAERAAALPDEDDILAEDEAEELYEESVVEEAAEVLAEDLAEEPGEELDAQLAEELEEERENPVEETAPDPDEVLEETLEELAEDVEPEAEAAEKAEEMAEAAEAGKDAEAEALAAEEAADSGAAKQEAADTDIAAEAKAAEGAQAQENKRKGRRRRKKR